jgi:hypothetical protein
MMMPAHHASPAAPNIERISYQPNKLVRIVLKYPLILISVILSM